MRQATLRQAILRRAIPQRVNSPARAREHWRLTYRQRDSGRVAWACA
ncbi:hypothetical protein [Achromobacter kerstersii]